MTGGDLDVAEVDSGVEHGGNEGVLEDVRVHSSDGDARLQLELRAAASLAHFSGTLLLNDVALLQVRQHAQLVELSLRQIPR